MHNLSHPNGSTMELGGAAKYFLAGALTKSTMLASPHYHRANHIGRLDNTKREA